MLEKYLADQYNRDLQDIISIEKVLGGVATTFIESYDASQNCWPYQLVAGAKPVGGSPSMGTSAMILAAIGKILGDGTMPNVSRSRILEKKKTKVLQPIFTSALKSLIETLKEKAEVSSTTFGKNNPLTISHLTELLKGMHGDPLAVELSNGIKAAAADQLIANFIRTSPTDVKSFSSLLPPNQDQWCAKSAFVALRIVRAQADLLNHTHVSAPAYKEFFENRIHEQLSFSSIPDSRFDPAELAFSLEGLIVCAREAVDPILFERVLSVLAGQQQTSAYWRPSRPFMARETGEIILPISVEGANSLLRSIEIVDGNQLYGTFAATAVPMFRRFLQWLRARKVEIVVGQNEFVGWHSEHVNETGAIHLWDTSQVVEFLVSFRKLLRRHIARETLILSRVKVDEPQAQDGWSHVTDIFEPLTDASIGDRIFEAAEKDFVEPWSRGVPTNYSILLYGPPGTGKTNFARVIANALKFRLITVTVSDFLGAGGALVEARAKAIFQMLEAQFDSVILFDEIDSFLLDRDSPHYKEQDTLFQFLTPGMLTKLNDLRGAARSIFVIATNYANRIDPAIKRPGRIDKQYLLLPPDQKKREEIVGALLGARKPSVSDRTELAEAALYLGYKEIEGALSGVSESLSHDDLKKRLEDAPRSSSDKNYLDRLGKETFPEKEFLAVVKMAIEANWKAVLELNIEAHRGQWERTMAEHGELKAKLTGLGIK